MIDKYDAPEGYIAVDAPPDACRSCALDPATCAFGGRGHSCMQQDRDDCTSVIFAKIEEKPVLTMALCEAATTYMQPDRLYRFVAYAGCAKCAELAAKYDADGNYLPGSNKAAS